jgi:hypothetical protein
MENFTSALTHIVPSKEQQAAAEAAIINRFATPRQPDEICLVAEITKYFSELGHVDPTRWTRHVDIARAKLAGSSLQKMLISNYWRLVLGLLEEDTQAQRYLLSIIDVKNDDYLTTFKAGVAPTIVRLGL